MKNKGIVGRYATCEHILMLMTNNPLPNYIMVHTV